MSTEEKFNQQNLIKSIQVETCQKAMELLLRQTTGITWFTAVSDADRVHGLLFTGVGMRFHYILAEEEQIEV